MKKLHLFEGFGVEIEYMIVDRESLEVRAICDKLIQNVSGAPESEIERGEMAWSNELVLHVLEFKTNGPADSLNDLGAQFQNEVNFANEHLSKLQSQLLPTGMHPWMNPETDTKLWPHEYNEVYKSFDRIFGCKGHGWANLQSTHLNLPFGNDNEFGRLHAAIRLVLPILSALSASTPIADSETKAFADYRMEVYRNNSKKIPQAAGKVIPERAFSHAEYQSSILKPLYKAIAPHDKGGILQHEWLNARGAIARFDRDAIEIRTIDTQECPSADIAVCWAAYQAVKFFVSERAVSYEEQKEVSEDSLSNILLSVIKDAGRAEVTDDRYLRLFGINAKTAKASDIWQHILERSEETSDESTQKALKLILDRGCLSDRILNSLKGSGSKEALRSVYQELAHCLEQGRQFEG